MDFIEYLMWFVLWIEVCLIASKIYDLMTLEVKEIKEVKELNDLKGRK